MKNWFVLYGAIAVVVVALLVAGNLFPEVMPTLLPIAIPIIIAGAAAGGLYVRKQRTRRTE